MQPSMSLQHEPSSEPLHISEKKLFLKRRSSCVAAMGVCPSIDNLLVQIQMIWWTGLAPGEFESPFPGSLTSTFPNQVWPTHSSLLAGVVEDRVRNPKPEPRTPNPETRIPNPESRIPNPRALACHMCARTSPSTRATQSPSPGPNPPSAGGIP